MAGRTVRERPAGSGGFIAKWAVQNCAGPPHLLHNSSAAKNILKFRWQFCLIFFTAAI
jgi:hypothetical protein